MKNKIRRLPTRLIKFIFTKQAFFLLISLIGFYLLNPPTLDFGDQSSYGLVIQTNLIEYQKQRSSFPGNFEDYFKQRYLEFHGDKIFSLNAYEVYGLDPKLKFENYLIPTHHLVFALDKLAQLAIYYLSFGFLGVEASLKLLGLIIFLLTYVYAFKLGEIVKDRRFGLFLAVVSVSNIYFNQLTRSMIFPFLSFYPLLFFASFYYLLALHQKGRKNKRQLILVFSLVLSFCFTNAYPNTNVLLYGLLGLFFLFFLDCFKDYASGRQKK